MVRLEDIARSAIAGEALRVRALVEDWLADHAKLSAVPRPETDDSTIASVAAALVELFAMRSGQMPPDWCAEIGSLKEPLYLLRHTATMPRLRRMCEEESPEPLRRRRIFAPADYLAAA